MSRTQESGDVRTKQVNENESIPTRKGANDNDPIAYSAWDSAYDYMENVKDVFQNTAHDVSDQYTEILNSMSHRITIPSPSSDTIGAIQKKSSNAWNAISNTFHKNANNPNSNQNSNNDVQLFDNAHSLTNSELSLPRTGLFRFLPKSAGLVAQSQSNKTSRTTSIDQVRSSLSLYLPQQPSQRHNYSNYDGEKSFTIQLKDQNEKSLAQHELRHEPLSPIPFSESNAEQINEAQLKSSTMKKDGVSSSRIKNQLPSADVNSTAALKRSKYPQKSSYPNEGGVSNVVAASQLAEGSLLALRDIILDEAVELHESLRFWNERWERPYLSWLEAGPKVWLMDDGYNHRLIGQKVSQIQAVLARRCATIGELQEHLLRAGWRKGVAQWGVLGQGDQWSTVVGGDGTMESKISMDNPKNKKQSNPKLKRHNSIEILPHATFIGTHSSKAFEKRPQQQFSSVYYGHSSVFVKNFRGGNISINDSAIASWSVDAIRVVRDQLYRAGNLGLKLPFYNNWPNEALYFKDVENYESKENNSDEHYHESPSLPIWAMKNVSSKSYSNNHRNQDKTYQEGEVVITDITIMAREVSELLDSIESQMEIQRKRRLPKLRPPKVLARSWYLIGLGIPALGYIAYRLYTDRLYIDLSRHIILKLSSFYNEHFSEPIRSIFSELVTSKGREDITDQKARMNAMESLQKMIKDWLDEVYPKMKDAERIKMATEMDISLIEKRKESSLRHALYEIQDIVRMSIIEMQFIKKELMNAMSAIDELMDSNEINFRLGAILPAFLVIYGANEVFKYLRYVLLKVGKSQQQTHAAMRQILLDIERLLVIRDDPPAAPAPLVRGGSSTLWNDYETGLFIDNADNFTNDLNEQAIHRSQNSVLNSNDLGMLMLLVHELRSILWKNRRRFSQETIRNIIEDLSELSGERGAVSIKQQLKILSRMYRTYSFLKVVSTGIPLERRIFV